MCKHPLSGFDKDDFVNTKVANIEIVPLHENDPLGETLKIENINLKYVKYHFDLIFIDI